MKIFELITKENNFFEIKQKQWIKYETKKNEEWFNRNENIKNLKLNIVNTSSIDDWSDHKGLNQNFIKNKKIKIKTPFIILDIKKHSNKIFLLKILKNIFNLIYYKNQKLDFNNLIFDFYNQIILKKFNKLKNQKKVKILIINIKKLKIRLTLMINNKCVLSFNSGYIFKKLQLKNKKYKKANKLIFIALKTMLIKNNYFHKTNELIVLTKGLNNKNYNKISIYIDKNITKKNQKLKTIYINNFEVSKNKFFKFKKIKSIKRRLKKKNQKNN